MTPDRNFSPLCLAVPRLQSASEHGLVSEEAVFNARLLSVARLLLPLSSPDLVNPLKSRVTLRPRRYPPDLYDGLDPTPAASVLAYTDSCTNAQKSGYATIQC